MISFTETDHNLPNIWRESKLFNLTTRNKFHVYGLRQQNNPAIMIEYNPRLENVEFLKKLMALIDFFKLNKIEMEIFGKSQQAGICVGLRKDLRGVLNRNRKPIFASSILQTIIYTLEDRIDLDEMRRFKLPNVPVLPFNHPAPAMEVRPARSSRPPLDIANR
jgi:hypothetical protein